MTALRVLLSGAVAVLSVALPASAIPPPPAQLAAQCESPTYASDVAVCADESLLALDRQVRALFESLPERPGAGTEPPSRAGITLVEGQDDWFRRRSRCAFSAGQGDCLRAAYAERLQVLEALNAYDGDPAAGFEPGTCRGAPWGQVGVRVGVTPSGAVLITDATGNVLAVATGAPPQDDWTPFLRHERDGSQLRLFPLEGPVLTCALREPD